MAEISRLNIVNTLIVCKNKLKNSSGDMSHICIDTDSNWHATPKTWWEGFYAWEANINEHINERLQ